MSEKKVPIQTDELEKQIRDVIKGVVRREMEPESDGLQYLNLDSLEKLEILASLEERFGVTLTEEVARQFSSVSSIARLLLRMRNANQENWQLPL
ncbi:MAG: acyl carrier protein [Deltaproteobacteria bacterium]|nr:acyl carrier protein [Deltaproteobacteria bacterium]